MLRSAAEEAAFTMPKHPKRRTRRNLAVLALSALCLTGFLYWDNTALQVTRFDPVFSDLPAGFDGCRIVVLSDLHGASFGAHNADLLAAVAAEQPEYIFFWGIWRTSTGGRRTATRRRPPGDFLPLPPPTTSPATTSGPWAECRR